MGGACSRVSGMPVGWPLVSMSLGYAAPFGPEPGYAGPPCYGPADYLSGWSFTAYDTGPGDCCVGPRPERCFKRRVTANRKERRRTLSINNAFSELRDCIPNVPSDTKLSKIKTLRLATSYIAYLMDLLAQGNDPAVQPQGGFKAELSKKLESREERRKKEIANLMPGSQGDRKSKGRTGWPQHVWALELKNDP